MMKLFYNLVITVLAFLARAASLFNKKAALWNRGLKGWESVISEKIGRGSPVVWMHCASLGEFEQGRPVLEEIRKQSPETKILLSFFSPSGYEIRKTYPGADAVIYLPPDTPGNARKLISLVNPVLVVFVKYEFWNNYISVLKTKDIPLYLISAIFRPQQHFFRWYGGFFRNMLSRFTTIFVQDRASLELLKNAGLANAVVAGDTRFDRVVQITGTARDIPELVRFRGDNRLFLAGSSWPHDEEIIAQYINEHPGIMKWVFAPHEIHSSNIDRLEKLFSVPVVRFSSYAKEYQGPEPEVMIIDNIGMLSSAYRYASVSAVGGGFGKGIHNVLEPACWGIPVLFGPNHKKFREAVALIESGGGAAYSDYTEFAGILGKWLSDAGLLANISQKAGKFVSMNTGATVMIMSQLKEKLNSRQF